MNQQVAHTHTMGDMKFNFLFIYILFSFSVPPIISCSLSTISKMSYIFSPSFSALCCVILLQAPRECVQNSTQSFNIVTLQPHRRESRAGCLPLLQRQGQENLNSSLKHLMPYRLDKGERDNLEASTVNYRLCQSWLSKSGKMDMNTGKRKETLQPNHCYWQHCAR